MPTVKEFMRLAGSFSLVSDGQNCPPGLKKQFDMLVLAIIGKVGDDDADAELSGEAEAMFSELKELAERIELHCSQ